MMVKHVILWKLNDEHNTDEVKDNIKSGLEGLKGKIDGLIDINVQNVSLSSSNADVMLDSLFESEEALKGYSVHADHQYIANTFVRPFTQTRLCLDFEVE